MRRSFRGGAGRDTRRAFTLMEVLLVLAILVILGGTATFFFAGMQTNAYKRAALTQINATKSHRRLNVDLVAHPGRSDEQVRRLARTLQLKESAEMSAAFPARRSADVSLVLADGSRLSSGPTEVPGDPEDALTTSQLEQKFLRSTTDLLGETRAYGLLDLLHGAVGSPVSELLDDIYAPPGAVKPA